MPEPAPESNPEEQRQLEAAVNGWMRDRTGEYTRPDPARPKDVRFAEQHGLIQNGISTTKARIISARLNKHRYRRKIQP
jgi:hypothetical protein